MINKQKYIWKVIKNFPNELKKLNHWVVHRNKIPFNARTHQAAKSNDLSTWSSFKEAVKAYNERNYDGIGICLTSPYIGVDIDDSLDYEVPTKLQSYTEYSPSGKGLHVIYKGAIPRSIKTKTIEVYNEDRYFTVTGNRIHRFPPILNEVSIPVDKLFPQAITKIKSSNWIEETIRNLHPGNIHNSFVSLIGKLWADGWNKGDIEQLLLPHIKVNQYDTNAFYARLDSVTQYPRQGNQTYDKTTKKFSPQVSSDVPESNPPEVFTPSTHLSEYERELVEHSKNLNPELPTGIPTLDSYTRGFKKGSIWIVGARTNVGKTSLSITISQHLLTHGKRVLFFSTEMDWCAIFDRFISLGSDVSLPSLESGQFSDSEKQRYESYKNAFKSLPLSIIDLPEPSIRVVTEEISRLRPDIFVLDHIQRVANSTDKRYFELSKFVKELNTVCRNYNVAGLVNSQLNRLADKDIPQLSHLKECGALEEEAHAVILLNKPDKRNDLYIADLAKNRGPKGHIQLKFNKDTCKFEEI